MSYSIRFSHCLREIQLGFQLNVFEGNVICSYKLTLSRNCNACSPLFMLFKWNCPNHFRTWIQLLWKFVESKRIIFLHFGYTQITDMYISKIQILNVLRLFYIYNESLSVISPCSRHTKGCCLYHHAIIDSICHIKVI